MAIQDPTTIENWTINDLENLPGEENDSYEYKSSGIANNKDKFADTITKAASAFWNTGGGFFCVGVDNNGHIDGGVEPTIGNQPITEWADQILFRVSPTGPYHTKFVPLEDESTKGVFVIAFGESANLPHQASDNKYYIRIGAHSQPASHYLLETLRARRTVEPNLFARVFLSKNRYLVLELEVTNLSTTPALNVVVNFDPFPSEYDFGKKYFPMNIPFIDSQHPFLMDIGSMLSITETVGHEPFTIVLNYENQRGLEFEFRQEIVVEQHIVDSYWTGVATKSEKALDAIQKELAALNKTGSQLLKYLSDKSDE